ncbi:MAG: CTP synthase (glutamine hydrolyzing) [Candidatus Micrarchaeia archaeon]
MQREGAGRKERRYIVVVGSLMSGLGKGIVSASIGKILQCYGFRVVPIKFDGYLNVDCGTMNPYRHGEVFVLEDGTECDMDFGTYERFLNIDLNKTNSLTGGKIFRYVIEKERRGGYLGYDVQIVPHLTNEIKDMVRSVGDNFDADIVLVEVGGTVGDLENSYFIEAMRQLAFEEKHVMFVQVTYVPMLKAAGEQKTKPTQHATKLLLGMGIQPSMIICREEEKLKPEVKKKIAIYCNVPENAIIDDPDVDTIYEVPLLFEKQGVGRRIMNNLGIKPKRGDMQKWKGLVLRIKGSKKKVRVGITGKYTTLRDAYVSIKEALAHAGARLGCRAEIEWIETTEIEDIKDAEKALKNCYGIIVPGGFGVRGAEGKICCIEYARKNGLPFLGLCFGFQLAVVEWARNVAGLKEANSTEIDPKTPYPVIDYLPEQRAIIDKGATMRLGAYPCRLIGGTKAHLAYNGAEMISERHRHRYEVNPDYVSMLEKSGLIISGVSPDGKIVEVIEWPTGWGVATQAHPEFKSRLERPAPLFLAFLKATLKYR